MDTQKKPLTPEENGEQEVLNTALQNTENEENEFQSTIFSASGIREVKKTLPPKKKRLITVISMLLAVAMIVASTYCVIKFVGNDDEEVVDTGSLKVAAASHSNVTKIEVVNSNGSFTILPKTVTEDGEETLKWYLEGIESPHISETMVGTVVDSCLSIYAVREMKDKTLDYGFDKPFAKVKVSTKDNSQNFSVTLGSSSPDKTGYYIKADGSEEIYLITAGTAGYINFTVEDLVDAIMLDPVTLTDETEKADKKYFDSDGAITTFDYIKLSGTKYDGKELVITPASDSAAAEYEIKTASGATRFANAESCEKVFGILQNGLVAVDAYKLSPTKEDISKFGLDNPEYTVIIKYGTKEFNLKATLYDAETESYSVMINGKDVIYKMSSAALDMLGMTETDFYNEYVFLEYYNSYSKVVIETEKGKYVFDTEYNENAETNNFTVYANGEKVDGDLFSAYYQHIVNIAPEPEESYVKGEVCYKAVFTFADTEKGTKTITLTKQSERRYLVTVDGVDMGIVTSRTYDNLTEYVQYIINGKDIPEP